jgi:Ca-activated chloride channel family protein
MLPRCSRLRPLLGLFLTSFLLAAPLQEPQKLPPLPGRLPVEDAPASIALVLDNSASMRVERNSAIVALCELAKASNAQDEFVVVNFNDDPFMDSNFTSNVKSACEALGNMDAAGGTALNDAVLATADHLVKGAKYKKRAIVLVTRGIDNKSHSSVKEMLKGLHEPGMPGVYSIGLLDPRNATRARGVLDQLANETGGIALYPENERQLNEMALQIAQEIRKRNASLVITN